MPILGNLLLFNLSNNLPHHVFCHKIKKYSNDKVFKKKQIFVANYFQVLNP
jgi:hypothetical protein